MRGRTSLILYFVLVFGISWSGVLLAAARNDLYLLLAAMVLGPAGTSIGLTAALEGTAGLRRLAQSLLRWRVGARWYLTLFVAPALLLLVLGALSLISSSFLPAIAISPTPGAVVRDAMIVGFGAGIFEEIGWTGFATPRLLRRYSWLTTGVLLGVPWALWHALPDYLGRSMPGTLWAVHMLQWLIALVAFRIFMTWIYRRTWSLLLGILLHASFTGGQRLLWPAGSQESELVWYGVFTVALWIVVAVVVLTRRATLAASPVERTRAMPADGLVPAPMFTVTQAITIDSPPERVWPWLAQLGSDRAGWYSHDWIDNGGRRSADRVIAEYQRVQTGDVLPALPGATDAFVVARVEAPRDLVLTVPGEGGPIVTWEHFVEPLSQGRSRLIVRSRVARPWKQLARGAGRAGHRLTFIEYVYRLLGRLPDAWMIALGGAGHRWMEARHLRGIKRRAEQAHAV